jgi:hypothetical protein
MFYEVTHTHTSFIEADAEAEACEACAEEVRENADASECSADEITEEEYNKEGGAE